MPFSPPLQNRNVHDDNVVNDNLKYSKEQFTQLHPVDVEGNYQADSTANYEQPVIYSNLLNNDSRSDFAEGERSEGENIKINPQRIREMYHNDVIYESGQNGKKT